MDRSQSDMSQPETINWEESLDQFERVMVTGTAKTRVKAILKLANLSESAPDVMLSRTIPILAGVLGTDYDDRLFKVQLAALYCLKCIASKGDGRLVKEIVQFGVVKSILRMFSIRGDVPMLRKVLVKCLWRLVSVDDGSRGVLVRNGGVEIVVGMLRSDDECRKYLLEILSALALLKEVRKNLAWSGGVELLIEAARCGRMVSRERACQAIGLMGSSRRRRHKLVELGVIPVLVELLREGDEVTKLVAGNALGVVSAHLDSIRQVVEAGAIPLYVELLEGREPTSREIAEDVLCVLAVVEENAVVIAENLVRVLREGDDEVKSAAADVMWDLPGYKHSVSVLRSCGAIPVMIGLLREGSAVVRERVSGVIAQMSYDEADRAALVDAGAVPILGQLVHESEELRDNALEALVNFYGDPNLYEIVDGVVDTASLEDMQNRLDRIRVSDEHLTRSLRRISEEQFTLDPELV